MTKRWMTLMSGGLLTFSLALLLGPLGCTGPSGSCKTNNDCQSGQTCDTATGKCGGKTTCTADADCGTGKVCDVKIGKCFADCTAAGVTCDPGNTCDQTLKRCTCDASKCKEPNVAGSGCHPVENVCRPFCTDDSQCTEANTKCVGPMGGKFCQDPAKAPECAADADCASKAPKTKCDTAASPAKCVEPAGCKENTDCTKDPNFKICNKTSGQCVACLEDKDCPTGKVCGKATFICEGPAACTDTKTCYEANKKGGYCDDEKKADGCKAATAQCDADNKVTAADNSSWTAGIEAGKGTIIWGAKASRITDGTICSDPLKDAAGSWVTCSANDDCKSLDSTGVCVKFTWEPTCKDGCCLKPIPNGLVEVEFSYYNPSGSMPSAKCHKCVVTHSKDGTPTDGLSRTSGDGTSGKGRFAVCMKGSGSYQFFIDDDKGDPSNALCYNAGAP